MGTEITRPTAVVPLPRGTGPGRVVRALLPAGRPLPAVAWRRRHRLMLALLGLHVPAIVLFAVAMGEPLAHGAAEAGSGGAPERR